MIAEANKPLGRPPTGRGRGRNRSEQSAREQIGGNGPAVEEILAGWSGMPPEGARAVEKTQVAPEAPTSHRNGDLAHELAAEMPDTLEWWADPDRTTHTPFKYLTALRQSPPGVKSFG
jgi:hypothetical protein